MELETDKSGKACQNSAGSAVDAGERVGDFTGHRRTWRGERERVQIEKKEQGSVGWQQPAGSLTYRQETPLPLQKSIRLNEKVVIHACGMACLYPWSLGSLSRRVERAWGQPELPIKILYQKENKKSRKEKEGVGAGRKRRGRDCFQARAALIN